MNSSESTCLSEDQLVGLLETDSFDSAELANHLEGCASCRERLRQLAGAGDDTWTAGEALASKPETAALGKVMAELRTLAPVPGDTSFASRQQSLDFLTPSPKPGILGTFAGYEILDLVASGGMGLVLKAQDPALRRIVAIKVLAPTLAARDSARARFVREARAAAALAHENVVAIHAVGEERGLPYLVMQFVQGRSLQARLAGLGEGPLELEEILRIALQTAAGLAAAHAQGLVHRDVKPGNILLENSVERVKLTDFGLARAVDEPSVTRQGVLTGTPEFMAPEQARGERADARSDLFALGVVMYAMATGQSPFAADNTLAALRKVCDEEPPRAHEVNRAIPIWLSDLIARLLAKRPEDRFQSAEELATVLRGALAKLQTGDTISIPPGTRKRRSPALLVVAAAALLSGLLALLWWNNRHPSSKGNSFALMRGDTRVATYTNLSRAITAATSGDVLEISATAPIYCDQMELGERTVTLRAAPGTKPVLVNRSARTPLFSTKGILALEGLELRMINGDSDAIVTTTPGRLAQLDGRSLTRSRARPGRLEQNNPLIHATGGSLFLAHCRLVGSTVVDEGQELIIAEGAAAVVLRSCELFRISGSVIKAERTPADVQTNQATNRLTKVRLENCVVFARETLLVEDATTANYQVEFDGNTFAGTRVADALGNAQLSFVARGNVFGVLSVVTRARGPLRSGVTIDWSGSRNLYRDPSLPRPGMPGGNPAQSMPELLQDLNSFVTTIQIAARIFDQAGPSNKLSAERFRITDVDLAPLRGPDHEKARAAGARVETVGPGAPYDAWRKTPSYREWLVSHRR